MQHRRRLLAIGGLLLCFVLLMAAAFGPSQRPPLLASGQPIPSVRVPDRLLNEDFQTPLDRDLTAQVQKAEGTAFSEFIDREILKPLIDDVNSMQYGLEGIEVTETQFPDRPELQRIVNECARIMRVPKPRVFVANLPGPRVFTTNFQDPIIVIHSSVLSRYTSASELRFLIGREMGHIRCSHVKWLMVLRCLERHMPDNLTVLALFPLLKWAREAAMSADNAGLICCQDSGAAELSLVRALLNVNEQAVGKISVDSYLHQADKMEPSCFAEAVFLWRQLKRPEPFVPDRVRQLHRYSESQPYRNLWEG